MSADVPDLTAILDDLFIGNLAAAKTLREHPELGITHVLSVCPEYPEADAAREGVGAAGDASCPMVEHPRHRCVPIQDSEYEDVLVHLPSAVAFIKDALEPLRTSLSQELACEEGDGQQTGTEKRGRELGGELTAQEDSNIASVQKHKVLVHCVMGISRSTTVVCAYLMATRQLSFPAALMFVRKCRPQVHPNFGFRRQLQIFGDCNYFANYPAPVRTHPAYAAWQRKKKREAARYLTRVGDVVEIKLDDEKEATLSLTDDFPTDPFEASSLLSEVEATHLLTISPASLPSLTPAPSPARCARRPSGLTSPPLSTAWSVSSSPDSTVSSPLSSRSSSFSCASRLSSSMSGPSTAATSVNSLSSLLGPSKLRWEASSSSSDSEDDFCGEPDYLTLAGVEHYHLALADSDPSDLLIRLSEASSFIQRSLCDDRVVSSDSGSESDQDLNMKDRNFELQKRVLIHCTTESRACAVVCAYLMSCKGLMPSQAYGVLEKALPLFNPTKSFITQLELFHDCDYNPTLDHPLVRSWLSGEPKPALSDSSSSLSTSSSLKSSRSRGAHWKVESDTEGDTDSVSLRRKLGTPMRCGSFSSSVPNPDVGGHVGEGQTSNSALNAPAPRSAGSGVDVEALLQRCEGVGDPQFAFDVEAFRGALRGIAADAKTKTERRA